MPLFFFISGYFVYNYKYDIELFRKRSMNRLIRQLYPTIVFWMLFCICFMGCKFSLTDEYKSGYWFTFVSIEMFFLIAPLFIIFSSKKLSKFIQVSILILIGILCIGILYIALKTGCVHTNAIWKGFSLSLLFSYMPFLLFGAVFKIQSHAWLKYTTHIYTLISAIAIYILAKFYLLGFIATLIQGFTGIIIIHYIFFHLFNIDKFKHSLFSQKLQFIGKKTLEIYLLHYFFINILKQIPHIPQQIYGIINTNYELPLCLCLSLAIAYICLGTIKLMKKLKIYNLLFPSTIDRFKTIYILSK